MATPAWAERECPGCGGYLRRGTRCGGCGWTPEGLRSWQTREGWRFRLPPAEHPAPVGHPVVRCQMIAVSTGQQCRGRTYHRGYARCWAHREAVRRYQHTCPGCGVQKPRLVADCGACGGSYPIPKWPLL